jgi:O-acetyl-ADP-ribose deacetylase (regulator of RNase III)
MTIIKRQGSLLDAKGIIVHGCNCRGVMGSGVALAVKTKWPQVYEHYKQEWASGGLFLGETQFVADVDAGVHVINAMTQEFYGREPRVRYVSYDAVATAFQGVRAYAVSYGVPVNFPLLGAGLGGGDWEIISTIIDRTLGDGIEKYLWVQ